MTSTELVQPRNRPTAAGASADDDAAAGHVLRSGRTTVRELWLAAAATSALAVVLVPVGVVGLVALSGGLTAAAAPGGIPSTGGRVLMLPLAALLLAVGTAALLARLTRSSRPLGRTVVSLLLALPLGLGALSSSLLVRVGDANGGGLVWPFLPAWAAVVVLAPAPLHRLSVLVRLLVAVTAVAAPFAAGPLAPGLAVVLALVALLPAALFADTVVGRLLTGSSGPRRRPAHAGAGGCRPSARA